MMMSFFFMLVSPRLRSRSRNCYKGSQMIINAFGVGWLTRVKKMSCFVTARYRYIASDQRKRSSSLRLCRSSWVEVAHQELDAVGVGDQQAGLRQAADVFLALEGELARRGWWRPARCSGRRSWKLRVIFSISGTNSRLASSSSISWPMAGGRSAMRSAQPTSWPS
jgi:hypothetical protein